MGKYQGYAKYKDSGVEWLGEIPEHWEFTRVKYLTEILRGKFSHRPRNDPKLYEGEYAFIQTGDVANANKFITDYTQTLNEDGYAVSKEFPSGTLVMTIAANIGDMAILDFNACFPDSIVGFIPSDKTGIFFLYYLFVSMRKQFLSTAVLNTQLNLNVERISNIFTVIPPLDEQESIAHFLDRKTSQIDTLIAKKAALLEKLDEKRTALISHAVTKGLDSSVPMKDSGLEWLGDIPEHWDFLPMKRFSEIYDCKHKTVSFVDDGFPVASIAQVQKFYIDLSTANKTTEEEFMEMIEGGRKPRNGDIIFSRNATVGASAIVRDDDFCMGQDVCLIRPIEADSVFLNYNFYSFFVKTQIANCLLGSTFKRINVEKVKNLIICLPSLEEQEEITSFIANRTAEIDRQKAKVKEAIELLKEYRTALITNAVTGKIDVRQVDRV